MASSPSPHVPPFREKSLDRYAKPTNKLRSEYAPDGTPLTMKPPESEGIDLILHPKSLVFLRSSLIREALYWLLGLLTAGLFFLLCRWLPKCEAGVRYSTTSMEDPHVTHVLVTSKDNILTISQILTILPSTTEGGDPTCIPAGPSTDAAQARYFNWRHERFWYSEDGWTPRAFITRLKYYELHAIAAERVVETDQRSNMVRLMTYGENVTEVDVPPFHIMLIVEALKPFFIFQVFSIAVWFSQQYLVYVGCIIILTVISVFANALGEWQNKKALAALARSEGTVGRVVGVPGKEGAAGWRMKAEHVSTAALMPGDLVLVEPDTIIACDLLLITGTAIMGEAMLTGESQPILKASIPVDDREGIYKYDADACKKYTLFSGTKVLQTRSTPYPPRSDSSGPPQFLWDRLDPEAAPMTVGMVLKTGFATARGQLVRTIMYPPPAKFNFEAQGYKFIWVLVGALVCGVIAQVIIYHSKGVDATSTILDILNLVTIAIPPALPLALTIGLQVSFNRLRLKGIFCSHTRSVAASGRVNCLCFDKTGTLTEDGLDLKGVQVSSPSQGLGSLISNPSGLYSAHLRDVWEEKGSSSNLDLLMSFVLAACHGISVIGEAEREEIRRRRSSRAKSTKDFYHSGGAPITTKSQGVKFIGDSLEVEVFKRSGWVYLGRPDSADMPTTPPESGLYDGDNIWAHPQLPASGVDTILFPPYETTNDSDACAIAICRRLDFDADLRRMGVVIKLLPLAAGSTREGPSLLIVKGAPESLVHICTPSSVPSNFTPELRNLTFSGYRVLGCGARVLTPDMYRLQRSELEKELTFVGLLSMENQLKKETCMWLTHFMACEFRLIMITGDNPLTAAAVAKMSGAFLHAASEQIFILDAEGSRDELVLTSMIDDKVRIGLMDYLETFFPRSTILIPEKYAKSFTVTPSMAGSFAPTGGKLDVTSEFNMVTTGRAFDVLLKAHRRSLPTLPKARSTRTTWTALEVVISRCNVFARMSPTDKQDLVRALQDLDLVVCMTGDGANDSGALKAGDIGISIAAKESLSVDSSGTNMLSAEEAAVLAAPSIAAPFSTGVHHIGACNTILTEGRCALTTSISVFKYMFTYGIIQFTGVLILYYMLLELADTQYLWADLGCVLGFVTVVPLTGPRKYLQRGRPETDLVSWTVLRSAVGQALIVVFFQIIQQVMLARQPWYHQSSIDKTGDYTAIPSTVEGTSKFIFSNYQYIFCIMAHIQTYGLFRLPFYKNTVLLVYFVFEMCMTLSFNFAGAADSKILQTAFKMSHMPASYRVYLFLLGMLCAAALMMYERYLCPHQSYDEPPVDTEAMPPNIVDSFSAEAQKELCLPALDRQATFLPKLRKGPPFYHQLNVAWRARSSSSLSSSSSARRPLAGGDIELGGKTSL